MTRYYCDLCETEFSSYSTRQALNTKTNNGTFVIFHDSVCTVCIGKLKEFLRQLKPKPVGSTEMLPTTTINKVDNF